MGAIYVVDVLKSSTHCIYSKTICKRLSPILFYMSFFLFPDCETQTGAVMLKDRFGCVGQEVHLKIGWLARVRVLTNLKLLVQLENDIIIDDSK